MGRRDTPRPYVRIDNDMGNDDKFLDVDDDLYLAAIGLHTLAIGWCDRKRTDGFLSTKALGKIAPKIPPRLLAEMLRPLGPEHESLWAEVDNGWVIQNYLDWQKSSETINELTSKRRESANARWSASSNASCIANSDASCIASEDATRNANGHASCNADTNTNKDLSALKGFQVDSAGAAFVPVVQAFETVFGSIPSDYDRKTMRAWVEVGFECAAIEAALLKAKTAKGGSRGAVRYANGILRSGPDKGGEPSGGFNPDDF